MAAPIPKDVLKTLREDEFMQSCCLCGSEHRQYHHNFEFARKALNEAWCILPLCPTHHDMVRNIRVRRLLDWAMLNRATTEQLKKYNKIMNHIQRRDTLNRYFGEFSPRKLKEHWSNNFHETKFGDPTPRPAVYNKDNE